MQVSLHNISFHLDVRILHLMIEIGLILLGYNLVQTGDMKRRPGNGIEGAMVCTS